jgi:hypothetical protein
MRIRVFRAKHSGIHEVLHETMVASDALYLAVAQAVSAAVTQPIVPEVKAMPVRDKLRFD